MNIEACLSDLENRISDEVETVLMNQWRDFCDGKNRAPLFQPRRPEKRPPAVQWPRVRVNQTLADNDAMLIQQLAMCSDTLANGTGAFLCVRANYGASILTSLFGPENFIMDDETNTLPTNRPLADPKNAVKNLLKAGVPDLNQGWGKKVFEMGRYYLNVFSKYPGIRKHVHIYHPDLQGPLDNCELLWGSEIFYDLVDEPGLVKDFLDLVTRTYIAFMREWEKIVPFKKGYNVHWSMLHKGNIMLRNDSAMNISPDMYDEFSFPYDRALMAEFGGGGMHFCGRGDHWFPKASELPGLSALQMSQPEYNDMETIYKNTVDKNITLLSLRKDAADEMVKSGRNTHGKIHVL